jgi:hypothetical protein
MRYFMQRSVSVRSPVRASEEHAELSSLKKYEDVLARAGVSISRESVQTPAEVHKVAAFAGLVGSAMAWG